MLDLALPGSQESTQDFLRCEYLVSCASETDFSDGRPSLPSSPSRISLLASCLSLVLLQLVAATGYLRPTHRTRRLSPGTAGTLTLVALALPLHRPRRNRLLVLPTDYGHLKSWIYCSNSSSRPESLPRTLGTPSVGHLSSRSSPSASRRRWAGLLGPRGRWWGSETTKSGKAGPPLISSLGGVRVRLRRMERCSASSGSGRDSTSALLELCFLGALQTTFLDY